MESIRLSLPLLPLLIFVVGQVLPSLGDLYDDYEHCKASGHFGEGNGSSSLVCDPGGRLTPQALSQLNGMLTDLERDVGCKCADGCGGKQYSVRLLVTNAESVEQSGGTTMLNETAERIWNSEGMGLEQCDNGMLLLYIRDQKRMVTYQGHRQIQIYSDQDIANLHELTLRTNRSGGALPWPSGEAEAQRRAGDDENSAPIIGLSVALALTFFVLFCLLCILVGNCCSVCCCRPKRGRKTAKYHLNPTMVPNYKSIEPIYIVTPTASEVAAFAPPSGASLYATATFPRHAGRSFSPHPPPMMLFGHPPPPPPHGGPLGHQPRSRSATPTSTQRSRQALNTSGGVQPTSRVIGGTAQSTHSTPEPNKRDKVNRTLTVRSNGTYYTASNVNASPEDISVTKKQSNHPQQPSSTSREFPDTPSPQNRPYAFLDPKRKQEVQTREEFIG
ncbi:hypothetical protein GPALN_003714 [Globodera pallida]|nr:hypothetical protein GPALN_003714 [Globodera pallida]